MWLIFTVDMYTSLDFGTLGILPRTVSGMIGILLAPLIHGNSSHLITNTFPLLLLGVTVYYFYSKVAHRVLFEGYVFTNLLVWTFGREFYHIGASGLVYSLASFLVFYGIFKRDTLSIVISALVILAYGGLIYGIFPQRSWVSWESHLMGTVVGLVSAFRLSRTPNPV